MTTSVMNRHAILLASRTGNYYAISPDEFSVTPVIMKDAECSLVDNLIAEKLILPTFRPDAPVLLRARGGLEHPVETSAR